MTPRSRLMRTTDEDTRGDCREQDTSSWRGCADCGDTSEPPGRPIVKWGKGLFFGASTRRGIWDSRSSREQRSIVRDGSRPLT